MGLTEMQELLSLAMANLPPGFRFHPTDEEVFVDYLAGGRQELIVIPEIDICMFEPKLLPNQFKERSIVRSNDPEGWFVCKQEQGQKARRSTREGFWKITGRPSEVKYRHTNQIVGFGYKRFLTFYKNVPGSKAIKSNWVMHEYYLPNDSTRSSVICHVMLKEDDKAISRPGSYLPLTEPHLNGSDSIIQVTGSWSTSSPSSSSRSERIDFMDIFDDSEPEDCNLSEDQIQMRMYLLSSCMTPNGSISQHSLSGAPDSTLMEFSFSSEDQDSLLNFSEESENLDLLNDIGDFDDQIIPQVQYELQAFCEEDTFISENAQNQMALAPKLAPKMESRVCVFDEAERGFVRESSNHTFESKLEGYGENSVPVNNIVSNRSSKLHNEFRHYKDSSLSKDKKIKMEIEPFIVKAKEVKKHATASSCLAYKKSKHSSQETRINCKTESMILSSPHDLSCFSTPPICYLINFLVGIVLLIFFIDQVF